MTVGIPAAIPTAYADVLFRSRLEATWSAMFDLLGWQHSYEPHDLPAGCVPDFVVRAGDRSRPVMIECKPADTIEELARERGRLLARAASWCLADLPPAEMLRGVLAARLRLLDDDAESRARRARDALLDPEAHASIALVDPTVDHEAWCLSEIDACIESLDRLPAPSGPQPEPRLAIVVGPELHGWRLLPPMSLTRDDLTLDGEHFLLRCGDHIGISDKFGGACAFCDRASSGAPSASWLRSLLREARNHVQWRPQEGGIARVAPLLRPAPRSCSRCGEAWPTHEHDVRCAYSGGRR